MTRRPGRRPRGRRPAESTPSISSDERALLARTALLDARARDPILLDMRPLTPITDYFIVCHGTSDVHIRGLADAVIEALEEQSVKPYGVEGYDDARWILVDYGDLIVHIFAEDEREFYSLERLWSDAERLPIPTAGNTTDA